MLNQINSQPDFFPSLSSVDVAFGPDAATWIGLIFMRYLLEGASRCYPAIEHAVATGDNFSVRIRHLCDPGFFGPLRGTRWPDGS